MCVCVCVCVCVWGGGVSKIRSSSDRSLMVDLLNYFFASQCPTTGITKAVVYTTLSVGWCI